MDQPLNEEKVDVRRKQSRDARKVQLIEATLEVLARMGYSRTTMGEVARAAGLSHGLVNFHFQSKEKLLAETLIYLSEEYRQNWQGALAAADPTPEARLAALLRADVTPALCTPARLSSWCAFWGEAQCRPMYQEHCGSNDALYIQTLEGLCADLINAHGYPGQPQRVARVIRVTTEGVWLDMMTMQIPYGREEALATLWSCAAAFFPRHFGPEGPLEAA